MSADALTDEERYPTLTLHGREMLRFLREHPFAPIFRNRSGNRLLPDDIERVLAFEAEVASSPLGATRDPPRWLQGFLEQWREVVPALRARRPWPAELSQHPCTSRADFARDIAQFVPDSAPVERLLNFRTSGTTGHPIPVPSHPVVAAGYLALYKRALRRFGIELRHGPGKVGVVLIGYQERCFTYTSVTPTMGDSGLVKLNLHESDWRDPNHRALYIDALAPELIAGDPLSFAELLRLPLELEPRAVLSTSMTLSHGLRNELESRFDCPVLDVYSMNEAGPIGVYDASLGGHVLLQPRLHVELLDEAGEPVAPSERGEITLTGGFNFCLPLVRYRTGDHARLEIRRGELVLVDLEGRPPVRFRAPDGRFFNNVDVTHALAPFSIARYTLHQDERGALHFKLCGARSPLAEVRAALARLFGDSLELRVEVVAHFEEKAIQYTSALRP